MKTLKDKLAVNIVSSTLAEIAVDTATSFETERDRLYRLAIVSCLNAGIALSRSSCLPGKEEDLKRDLTQIFDITLNQMFKIEVD